MSGQSASVIPSGRAWTPIVSEPPGPVKVSRSLTAVAVVAVQPAGSLIAYRWAALVAETRRSTPATDPLGAPDPTGVVHAITNATRKRLPSARNCISLPRTSDRFRAIEDRRTWMRRCFDGYALGGGGAVGAA